MIMYHRGRPQGSAGFPHCLLGRYHWTNARSLGASASPFSSSGLTHRTSSCSSASGNPAISTGTNSI